MCEFETPSFVYYSYTAVIILSLITGLLILSRNPKHPMNRNAFYFILIITLWTINDLIQWVVFNAEINMFFARISYLANFVMLFFLYFSYYFTNTPLSFKRKLLLAAPFVVSGIITLFSNSHFVISDFDLKSCDYIPGDNIFISYVINIVYAFLATRILLKNICDKTTCQSVVRSQSKFLILAIWLFILWEIVYEETGKATYFSDSFVEVSPHFIIGNLFFVSLITFGIIKKDLFQFQEVFMDWFTIFLWSAIFAGLFVFATNPLVTIMCAVAYAILMVIFFKM